MNAAAWFNASSFHQHQPQAPKIEGSKADACWDSWDETGQRWRHYARKDGRVYETDEIGVAL